MNYQPANEEMRSGGRSSRFWLDQACVAALLVALGIVVAGCFGGNSPQRTYYTVGYSQDALWNYEEPRYPLEVRVTRFEADTSYDRQEMVYRSNPHEFQYYAYRLWSAKPRKMMREVFHRHLRSTNLFQDVSLEIDERLPDFDLEVEILAIEELNADAETWFAHLAARLTLVRFSTGKRVWQYSFDERKQVYNREPVYVVRAMSEIAESEFSRAFAELDAFLAEETGVEAPEGGPGVIPEKVEDSGTGGESGEGGEGDGDDGPKAVLKNKR